MFGAVTLTKHTDIGEYKYSGYCIGLHKGGTSLVGNGFGRNCIIFGVDMSSSVHAEKKKNII